MTIEPKSYHEKKGPHAFLDFENSAIDVEDAVISFGNWDRRWKGERKGSYIRRLSRFIFLRTVTVRAVL